jgi:hypothetical protein
MHDLGATSISSRELIDAVMDRYVAWRERSAAVELAYRDWCRADPEDREAAYTAYADALDREEFAAQRYRALLDVANARTER